MSLLLENSNLFLFQPPSFCKQHTHTHEHTHTKDILVLPLSFSFCLSFVNEKHTHTRTKELSGNVLFSFFLSSALTFIICLLAFVLFCQFLFCESYMLLLHCRYKGYNANIYRIPNTAPNRRLVVNMSKSGLLEKYPFLGRGSCYMLF